MTWLTRWASDRLPQTFPTIAFLSVTALETVVDAVLVAVLLNALESSIIDSIRAKNESSVLPVYLGLFVLAHLFQLFIAFDALNAKNFIQIVGLIIFNTLFLIYAFFQIIEIKSLITGSVLRILVWIIPTMVGVTEVIYLSTAMAIFSEFGWSIFHNIGADLGVKRMLKWFQVFICIVKFDAFLFLSFSLQLVLLVPNENTLERGLTIAALPVTLFFLVLGFYSIKRENRALFTVFMGATVAGACYFAYKLFMIYKDRTTDYVLVYKSLTLFAALCLAALGWTSITALICFRNFGRGLAKLTRDKAVHSMGRKASRGHILMESANSSRMSM